MHDSIVLRFFGWWLLYFTCLCCRQLVDQIRGWNPLQYLHQHLTIDVASANDAYDFLLVTTHAIHCSSYRASASTFSHDAVAFYEQSESVGDFLQWHRATAMDSVLCHLPDFLQDALSATPVHEGGLPVCILARLALLL